MRRRHLINTARMTFLAAGVLLLRPRAAVAADGIGPDQAIAVLASIVKDRAHAVAAETIVDELSSSICGRSLAVQGKDKTGLKTLCFGGDLAKCKKAHADDDDVFVASCRLITDASVTLTDPHLLKDISNDSIALMLRLAAYKLDAKGYEDAHLPAFARFVSEAIAALSREHGDASALAEPIEALAADLQGDLPGTFLGALVKAPEVSALTSRVTAVLDASCNKAPTTLVCKELKRERAQWFPPPSSAGTFRDSYKARIAFFNKLFGSGGEYEGAKNLPCNLANPPVGDQHGCQQAQLLTNVNDILRKLPTSDVAASMVDVRELTYILLEEQRHSNSLTALNGGVPVKEFADFIALVRKSVSSASLAREELATGVDLIGAVLAAKKSEPDLLAQWLKEMNTEVLTIAETTPPPAAVFSYLDAPAFRSDVVLTEPVARVRSDLKNMSVIPWLGWQGQGNSARVAVMVRELSDVQSSAEVGLGRLAAYMRVLADALTVVDAAHADATLGPIVDALARLADSLDLAADKDWIGIGIKLTDQLDHIGALDSAPMKRSLGFVRILLSSYQAATPEEAKAIFESGLENVSSRRQRFEGGSVDVAALFAARGGYDSTFAANGMTTTSSSLYGLFAPVGVQFAYAQVGFLVYPIDVGSYLTVTKNESNAPQWRDSLRFGAAVYLRPSAHVPIAIGPSADMRPTIGDRPGSWRVFGMLALELPLYLIY